MSYVFSAFAVAYALFEIPSAWWGERIGTRRVLTRIVCWWSAFTIATPRCGATAACSRCGSCSAPARPGAWPNAARTFSRWIPAAGARARPGRVLRRRVPLRRPDPGAGRPARAARRLARRLRLLRVTGFVWAAAWFRWFRDEPADHPQVGAAELALITEGRGRAGRHDVDGQTLRRARRQRERVGAVPRLLLEQLRLVLRHDVAADLSGRAPRLHRRLAGPLFRPADAPQRRLGPPRRHRHRPARPAPRPARRPGGGRPGQLRGGSIDDGAVGRHRQSADGGHPAGRATAASMFSWRALGGGHRHRRRPCRRPERLHEHHRPDRQHQQPDRGRLAGRPLCELGPPALRDGRPLRLLGGHLAASSARPSARRLAAPPTLVVPGPHARMVCSARPAGPAGRPNCMPAITIVGAGVAGLTIGHQLARQGYAVTVLEEP